MSHTIIDVTRPDANIPQELKIHDFMDKGKYSYYPVTDQRDGRVYFKFPGMFSFGIQSKKYNGDDTGKLQMAFAIGKRGPPGGKASFTPEEQEILKNMESVEKWLLEWITTNAAAIVADARSTDNGSSDKASLIEYLEDGNYNRAMFDIVFRSYNRPGREHEAAFLYSLFKSFPVRERPEGETFNRNNPKHYKYGSTVYYPDKEVNPLMFLDMAERERYCTAYPSLVIEGISMGKKRLTFNMTINDVAIVPRDRSSVRVAPVLESTSSSNPNPDEYGSPEGDEEETQTVCNILGN